MATWKKSANGQVEIDFGASDLVLFNIQNTKKTLSEVLDYSSFKITMKDIQEIDSSGLQLLIYFISKIKTKDGQVEFEILPPEVASLCALYGVGDMGKVEKIKCSSNNGEWSDV